jgi:CheY-like chemotaxis protein
MKTLKILLVDDDDAIRNMYVEIFQKEGFIVLEAHNGVEGLDSATKNMPDIIFTGIVMPVMDGFAMIEALKKNVATSKTPVVISSHLGREEDQRRATELGTKGFFVRGLYTPNEIVEKIQEIFKASEYKIKFMPNELDAEKLSQDMGNSKDFKCLKCGGNLILVMKVVDMSNREFSTKIICSGCEPEQN